MSAGFQFWWLPEEEGHFLHYVTRSEDVMAMTALTVSEASDLKPLPIVEFIDMQDPQLCFFGLEKWASNAPTISFVENGETRYRISQYLACLIMYRRGRISERSKLSSSVFTVHWNWVDTSKKTFVSKDPDFKVWAERVLRWVRKATPKRGQSKGQRVSIGAQAEVDRGRLELIS